MKITSPDMKNLFFLLFSVVFLGSCQAPYTRPDTRKIVVLTFDDAVKSHYTFVAPLLKDVGLG